MNNWKSELYELEKLHDWDAAIALMNGVLQEDSNSVDAYLSMAFLIMYFLGEERDYETAKFDSYILRLTNCYEESKLKFSKNPNYLYYMGFICWMLELYFMDAFNRRDIEAMLRKAHELDPSNVLYYYCPWQHPNIAQEGERSKLTLYIKEILDPQSSINKELADRGLLGEYVLRLCKPWAIQKLVCIENFLAGNLLYTQVIKLLQVILRTPEINGNLTTREMLAKNIDLESREQHKVFEMAFRFFVAESDASFFTKEKAYQAIIDFLLRYYNEYHEKEILAFKNQLEGKKEVFEKYFMQVLHNGHNS